MISCIIYDLDGTLIDSAGDIAYGVNRVREYYDLAPLSVDHVKLFVGDGAEKLLERAVYGLVEDRSLRPERTLPKRGADPNEVLDRFLSVYAEDPVAHTHIDETVEPALRYWQKEGVAQAVLTNKPQRITMTVLDRLELTDYFDVIVGRGARDDDNKQLPFKPDPATIDYILDQTGAPKEETWVVGDGIADVTVARECGLEFVGLLSGYVNPERFVEAADNLERVFNSFGEVYAFLREQHAAE